MTSRGGSGSEMVIGWFASERRERRRKVRLDRKHLEPRARRFLKIYLNADETRKPEFYQAVQEASEQCRPSGSSLPPLELEDAQVAEATSSAAMQIVLERSALNKSDRNSDFVTDAWITLLARLRRALAAQQLQQTFCHTLASKFVKARESQFQVSYTFGFELPRNYRDLR